MAVTNLHRAKLALIGAAFLGTALPATALAQREDRADWGHGGERRGGGGGGGGQAPQAARPAPAPAPQAAPASHGGWQGQPQGNWAARPAPSSPVAPTAPAAPASPNWASRGGGGNGGGWNGGGWNHGAPQSPAAPQAAPAPQAPVAQAPQPPNHRWDRDSGRGGNLANGTYQGRAGAPPAQPWPRDRNDWVNRGTAGVPHYATRDGDHWRDAARGWSRDWRGDRRYDWQAWRGYHGDIFRLGRYHPPYRDWGYRRLTVGFVLDSLFWGDNYWIADPWFYRLPPAYGPYRWVRYFDDALLVDTYTGQVVDVIYGVFW